MRMEEIKKSNYNKNMGCKMFNDIFKFKKCECCDGKGKSDFHLFHHERDEVEIIRKTFPKFDPEKSCDFCFGKGETSNLTTGLADHELLAHMQNKISSRISGRE